MKYVAVLPYAYAPYYEACKATMAPELVENTLFIDNTIDNQGVAGSWDLGINRLKEVNGDWLIVISAAMRFGVKGGLDMIEQLEAHPDCYMVHFAKADFPEQEFVRGTSPGIEAGNFSWHLTAISRQTIENVGRFDANFYPLYFEDIDYDLRVKKYYQGLTGWTILPIDAHGSTVGHAVELGGIVAPSEPLIAYFATKWGRHPAAAQLGDYDTPFDNKDNSLAFWPPAHGRTCDE